MCEIKTEIPSYIWTIFASIKSKLWNWWTDNFKEKTVDELIEILIEELDKVKTSKELIVMAEETIEIWRIIQNPDLWNRLWEVFWKRLMKLIWAESALDLVWRWKKWVERLLN